MRFIGYRDRRGFARRGRSCYKTAAMLPIVQPAADERPDLRSLPYAELGALVERLGERPFRVRQLYRWLHKQGVASLDEMTDLPKALRERLAAETRLSQLALDAVEQSVDGTRKYRLRTHDGRMIESVYMPDEGALASAGGVDDDEADEGAAPAAKKRVRRTLCVSSQVGCAMDCKFCLTATMGLVRHLAAGEIVEQVYRVNADLRAHGSGLSNEIRPLTNLVFMGMGEPLHNYENVKASLDLLLSAEGANFSHRHVTVSTSGHVPNIKRLGEETDVKLAISLNATTDETRSRLMPINVRWPLEALMQACREFPMRQGRRITFEYVLLAGVNDTVDDALRLAKLVAGVPAKVNLIPYNDNADLGFHEPPPERVEAFKRALVARHVTAIVRKNRGRDISGACGQLAVAGQERTGSIRA